MLACLVGIPVEIRNILQSALKKERERQQEQVSEEQRAAVAEQADVALIFAKVGSRGSYSVTPNSHVALGELVRYIDSLAQHSEANIIVLPYAELPDVLDAELRSVEEYGGCVKRVRAGKDEWPSLSANNDKKSFQDALFRRLWASLFPPGELPSAHLRLLENTVPQVLIAEGALITCDRIPAFRLEFIRQCGMAMRDYVLNGGQIGPFDEYFKSRGLIYAKTGGSKATLNVYRAGICVYSGSSYEHLKMGDVTTPQAATRFYFHFFDLDNVVRAVILYAGVHPSNDINGAVHL